MILFDDIKEIVQSAEFLPMCLGKCIGQGISRKVYIPRPNLNMSKVKWL